ncbi:MAG: alkanesulfonate monooxygenase SsuD [Candidatus Poriferisodalaceae bacterium]|jgi:alkanesulfonate monooxygenase SsuD/methylene tetrahydromethanopterin reductase-like flavin-dependent oxidoreductase (luciferase family)
MTSSPELRVGVTPAIDLFARPFSERQRLVHTVADLGLDHVFFADHVSFHSGAGTDGMVAASAIANLHPDLGVYIAVYLLALRHPVPVARQLATLAEMAPGRISFGVGVGGEDRHEIEVCGIDPRTRGRRTDAALDIVTRLLDGEHVNHHSEFYEMDDAFIRPTPTQRIPVFVGGRSDKAVVRAGEYGDGWLASWCSARRFAEATQLFSETAANAGRSVTADHGIQLWVGVNSDPVRARELVKHGMEGFYKIPFELFEKYTPVGTAPQIAEWLAPYLDAGCTHFNLTPVAESAEEGLETIAEVRRLLVTR